MVWQARKYCIQISHPIWGTVPTPITLQVQVVFQYRSDVAMAPFGFNVVHDASLQ